MKNKIKKLLLPIIFLGFSVAIWVAITRSTESSNESLLSNEVWTFQANGRILVTPILIGDQIIFRTADKIYSISAFNGNINWEIAARAPDMMLNEEPLVGNSKYLVSGEQGNSISIYSTETGKSMWRVEDQVTSINTPIEIIEDIMAVARHDGNLVVYDLTSHQKLWEVALPPRSPTPIAASPDLVIVGMGDVLRVYGLKDGSLQNEKLFSESLVAEIALNGSNIYVSHAKEGGDWTLSSLQLDSLDANWEFHVGKITHPYLSSTSDYPSLFNQTLLLLDTNNGNVLWEGDVLEYYSAPVFHQNNFLFTSKETMFDRNRKICKVEISEGTTEGCSVDSAVKILETSHPSGLLVVDDLLIVPRNSELVAFIIP